MHVLFTYRKIYTGYRKHDYEENDSRRRCVRGIASALTVEHIVYVTYYCVHLCYVKVASEEGNRIAIRLECADKTGDYEVEEHRRDEGNSDLREHSEAAGAVNPCRIIIVGVDRGDSACEYEYLEGENDPHRVEAKHEHFCPIRAGDKVDGLHTEKTKHRVNKSCRMVGFLEKKHKYETYRQRIGNVGQEENRLEKIAELLYAGKTKGNKQGKKSRYGNCYDNQNKGILHCLNKEGVVQHVKVVVDTYSEESSRCGIEALLKGINENVDQGVNQEYSEKDGCGQYV